MINKAKLYFKNKRNKKIDELLGVVLDQNKNIGIRKRAFEELILVGNKLSELWDYKNVFSNVVVSFKDGYECSSSELFFEDALVKTAMKVAAYLKS